MALSSDLPFTSIPVKDEFAILRYVLVSVSIPVNLVVISVVSASRQLHAPRHIFWAGVSIAFLLISFEALSESFIRQNRYFCALYELGMGIWNPTLLLFLSLAGWDRYAAIRHYEWYRNHMTNRKALFAMIAAFFLNALIFDSPYWTGYKSLFNCSVNKAQMHCVFLWYLLLSFINIALQVQVFIESRKVIRKYSSSSLPHKTYRFSGSTNHSLASAHTTPRLSYGRLRPEYLSHQLM